MEKKNNVEFTKSPNQNFNSKVKNHQQNKRNILITKIQKKYNVSYSAANEILVRFEKKKKMENNYKFQSSQVSSNNNQTRLQESVRRKRNSVHNKQNKPVINEKVFDSESVQNSSNVINKNQNISKKQLDNINLKNNVENLNDEKKVNSLLEDIIPDYNQQISINLNHVDLTFEVQNEKVDTLKETFIRILKREKSKKIKIHVLKDISFKIYKGEKVGIIGYNGAGKSTLLNVITGIYPPDGGTVTTTGKISPLLSLGAGFDFNFSGRKNIILNGAILGYDKKYIESKMDEIIEFSELGEFIDIPIKNYSSGMMAKLGFSIATAVEPDILIIDEILGVGDVNFAKKSSDKIRSLMDGGTTVLLVSHSIPQIRKLCDKAIWIDNGNLREIGEVNKVCNHYLKDAEKANQDQLANIQFR